MEWSHTGVICSHRKAMRNIYLYYYKVIFRKIYVMKITIEIGDYMYIFS